MDVIRDGPGGGFQCVATRCGGAAADGDAGVEGYRIDIGKMRQLAQFRAAADAGQQQLVPTPLCQQAQGGFDPIGAAGEGHDAVGVWRCLRRLADRVDEPGEPQCKRDDDSQQTELEASYHPDHGKRRSQRRTVPCAVMKPIAAAAAGRPGSVSHSTPGSAPRMLAGDVGSSGPPAKGAAKLARASSTGRATTAPAMPPVVASRVARPANLEAI